MGPPKEVRPRRRKTRKTDQAESRSWILPIAVVEVELRGMGLFASWTGLSLRKRPAILGHIEPGWSFVSAVSKSPPQPQISDRVTFSFDAVAG